MDVRQLELFLAVLESSSLTRAAEKVHLTPAAVSWQLRRLATELKTDLFVRSGRRLSPTPAAHRLAVLATSVLRLIHQIEHEFRNDPSADKRPFRFATGSTALVQQLGRPLRLLRSRFPNTPLEITVSGTEEMVSGLLERRFDLALISLPVADDRLEIAPLLKEEMLILKPSPTLVRGWHIGSLRPADLATVPFLLYPKRTVMRTIADEFFRRIGVTPKVAMEADDAQAIRRLVEAGFGYSILSEHAIRGRQRYFHMYRVPGHHIAREQALATVRTEYPRALTESIARFLRGAVNTEK
jgi:DNA-binding transcriptional LysR family regulator